MLAFLFVDGEKLGHLMIKGLILGVREKQCFESTLFIIR